MKNEKLYDVIIIRSFAIIVVVAFHAYGMLYAEHFPILKDKFKDLYYTINQCYLINLAMPLFVFISGYLFAYLLGIGKYLNFLTFIKNKFKRLIIPYWIFSILIMITTNSFKFESLIKGGYSHLWFITMLFWCFIGTYILHKKIGYKNWRLNSVFLILSFFLLSVDKFLPPILGLHNLSRWFFWFYLGYIIYPYKALVITFISRFKCAYFLILIYFLVNTITIIEYDTRTLSSEFGKLSMVLLLWYITNKIIELGNNSWIDSSVLTQINNCSYGIYIFHNWIQPYLISRTVKMIFPLNEFAANHLILFPILFFISSLLLSFLLAKFFLKTLIGRFLIG